MHRSELAFSAPDSYLSWIEAMKEGSKDFYLQNVEEDNKYWVAEGIIGRLP